MIRSVMWLLLFLFRGRKEGWSENQAAPISPCQNLFISSQGRKEAWREGEELGGLGWTSLALEGDWLLGQRMLFI